MVELRCSHDARDAGRGSRRAQGEGHHPVGERGRTRSRPRCGSTTGSSPSTPPAARPTSSRSSTRARSPSCAPGSSRASRRRRPGDRFQFERLGFFFVDPVDSKPGAPVFNRTVGAQGHVGEDHAGEAREGRRLRPRSRRAKRRGTPSRGRRGPARAPRRQALRDAHGLAAEDARILAADAGCGRSSRRRWPRTRGAKAWRRWVVNEVLREAKARGRGGAALPGRRRGRAVRAGRRGDHLGEHREGGASPRW